MRGFGLAARGLAALDFAALDLLALDLLALDLLALDLYALDLLACWGCQKLVSSQPTPLQAKKVPRRLVGPASTMRQRPESNPITAQRSQYLHYTVEEISAEIALTG